MWCVTSIILVVILVTILVVVVVSQVFLCISAFTESDLLDKVATVICSVLCIWASSVFLISFIGNYSPPCYLGLLAVL